ncbi:hypothetical protein BH23GEM10_BH23GEM10_10660 [soil metagenome]
MRIVDSASGTPIPDARVSVLSSTLVLPGVLSDSNGIARIQLPRPGLYPLRVQREGYRTVDSVRIEVLRDRVVEVDVALLADPVVLDAIVVTARRRAARDITGYAGLYARRAVTPPVGTSRVVLKDDPQMSAAIRVADVLKWFVPTDRCINYLINERWAALVDVRDLPVAIIEGIEFYKHQTDAPPHLRSLGRCMGWYSIVAVWLR